MKNVSIFLLYILLFSFQSSWGYDSTSVDTVVWETAQDSSEIGVEVIQDSELQPNVEEENPYNYNQLFMFGFLVLGAVLVVWKFRNNS